MTVVSTNEFNANQGRYFDLAMEEQVFVKRGDYMFHISCSNINKIHEQEILEPDDDLRSAITAEELIKRIQEDKRRNFAAHL